MSAILDIREMENEINILVVDDDPGIVSVLRRGLAFEGYAVSTASDGAEALAKLRNTEPDITVTST